MLDRPRRPLPVLVALLGVATLAPLLVTCSGVDHSRRGPPLVQRLAAAGAAIAALRDSRFEDAAAAAAQALQGDADNPYARIVAAITRYKSTMHQLQADVISVAIAVARTRTVNHRYLRSALEQAEKDLGLVEQDLAVAADFSALALELCLACWKIDWNKNGRLDSRDERFLQIEVDADGNKIPQGDPRRKPTFRFDVGDVHWARAFVSFQRAVLDLALAYRWTDVDRLLARHRHEPIGKLTIKLELPDRIRQARRLILEGLDRADDARRAYLAETDDDREWLPNPRQKSHPMPLPVDDALYETWEQVTMDVRRMVRGDEGLSVSEVAQLGDHKWPIPPGGFVDIGGMLARPKDIVVDVDQLRGHLEDRRDVRRGAGDARPEPILRTILGEYYREEMRPTPLLKRLERMKQEIHRGKESFDRKLRYLLWVN